MNRYIRTCPAVVLVLGTLSVSGVVQAVDHPPTTPATVTANRYSATGADVIWTRSIDAEGAVRGYEIVRDGVSLGIRDALSVTETSLVPGRSYRYAIASVDAAGQRSAPILVTLGTNGSSTVTRALTPSTPAPPVATPPVATPAVTPTPASAGPAAPGGLRAYAYSGTAGEIGWARPSTPGLRYEVSRDGTPLATTDGISHVDGTLSPGRDYRYEVVAIDRSNRRSTPASVTLRSQGIATDQGVAAGSDPFTPTAPVVPTTPAVPVATADPMTPAGPTPPVTTLAAPTELRVVAYSPTAAEVFWRRPTTSGLRYEVRRDGALVKTTDGVSHYDGARVAGRDHRYDIVALDGDGRRSSPAGVTLSANGGGGAATPVATITPAVPITPVGPTGPTNPSGVTAPPADVVDRLGLDADYYERYIDVDGLSIIGSGTVSPYALAEAAWMVRKVMARRPDLMNVIARNKARLVILDIESGPYDLPEIAALRLVNFESQRAMFNFLPDGGSITISGEENILQLPGTYLGPTRPTDPLIHEIAHLVDLVALRESDVAYAPTLDNAWRQAVAEGLWRNTYAARNSTEYFAVGTEFWFGSIDIRGSEYEALGFESTSREELANHDPRLAALLAQVYGDNPWRYAGLRDRTYGKRHLDGYTRDETRGLGMPNDGQPALPDLERRDDTVRSGTSGAPTRLWLSISLAIPTRIYFIRPDGTRQLYSSYTIPYATFPIDTYAGAVWEVTTLEGETLSTFRAEPGARTGVVGKR